MDLSACPSLIRILKISPFLILQQYATKQYPMESSAVKSGTLYCESKSFCHLTVPERVSEAIRE